MLGSVAAAAASPPSRRPPRPGVAWHRTAPRHPMLRHAERSYDDTEDIEIHRDPSRRKSRSFHLLDGIDRGFAATSSQRKAVTSALERSRPSTCEPTDARSASAATGRSTPTRPTSSASRMRARSPSCGASGSRSTRRPARSRMIERAGVVAAARRDLLERSQQRVCLTYEVEKGTRCVCQVNTFGVNPQTFFGVNLRSSPPLKLPEAPFKVPFGNFDVLYNDGDIRVVRTIQGYYGVNRRITAEEEMWG